MGNGSITLFRLRGIPIRAHWSLLLALIYITISFSHDFQQLTQLADVRSQSLTVPSVAWGVLVAVGLFVSVALHELAHSLFAIRKGGRVREITLMIVGGVSRMERMPPSLYLEGWMAFVGPLASFAIAGLLWVAYELGPRGGGWADLHLGLFYLASLNLSLAVFNLLPAFPMDGGRVLRALLGHWLGRPRATFVAARVGQAMALLFGIVGIITVNFLLVLIAVFLFTGATGEAKAEEIHQLLAGLTAKDVMNTHPLVVGSKTTLREALRIMANAGKLDAIVTDDGGAPTGIIRAQDLTRRGNPDARVGEILGETSNHIDLVAADEPAEETVKRIVGNHVSLLGVRDEATPPHVLGFIGPSEIRTALVLRGFGRAATRF